VEHTQKIMMSLQTMTYSELNQVFDEYDLCNALVANLTAVLERVLDLDPDAVQLFINSARASSATEKAVLTPLRALLQTLHHSLEFIKASGLIFDYLFVDSYRYEQIFRLFMANAQLVATVVKMVTEHAKFDSVLKCFSKNKEQARSAIPLVFAKVFFKMLTNQCDAAKIVFLQSQTGVKTLKSWLTTFRQSRATYEIYLYCLGTVPALLTLSQSYNEDFIDAGYVSLLARQLISFQEEDNSSYIGMVTPLLLALKALVTASPEMKEELKVNLELINVLYTAVSSSYGNRSHTAHMHLAGTILMCELGHEVFSKVIGERLFEMKQ